MTLKQRDRSKCNIVAFGIFAELDSVNARVIATGDTLDGFTRRMLIKVVIAARSYGSGSKLPKANAPV